jgi:hypothetical protein
MHYTIKQACEIWGFKQGKFVNWEYNGTIPREPDRTKLEYILTQIENPTNAKPLHLGNPDLLNLR